MNKQELFDKFFYDIDLNEISNEAKEKLFDQVFKNLENRLLVRISAILSDEDRAEWKKIESDEALDKFYDEKGVDIESLSKEEALLAREQLIQNIAYIKGKME